MFEAVHLLLVECLEDAALGRVVWLEFVPLLGLRAGLWVPCLSLSQLLLLVGLFEHVVDEIRHDYGQDQEDETQVHNIIM